MGYDLHITRADDWLDAAKNPITLEQWLSYIESDKDMRLDGAAKVELPNQMTMEYQSEGLTAWTAYSKHGVNQNMAWFDFRDAEIVVKNPDEEIIAKMKSIAQALNANVIGDDGESY